MSEIPIISDKDLSLVEENLLNPSQLNLLLKKTPEKFIHQRPAKGGGKWDYVTGGYVKKALNLMFGWDWSFEILDKEVIHGEAIVHGKLTVRVKGREIVKHQFGNKDVICRKGSDKPLSIGNDLKAAATDALKKCASELGIAADIYNKLEFKEVRVVEDQLEKLIELYQNNEHRLSTEFLIRIKEIIEKKEKSSYDKAIKELEEMS